MPNQPSIWSSEPLADGPIAIVPPHSGQDGTADDLWTIATQSGSSLCLRANQLADFLTVHRDRTFVCEDAGEVFWSIEAALRTNNASPAIATLHAIVDQARLVDVDVWRQLVELAEDGYAQPHAGCGQPPEGEGTSGAVLLPEETCRELWHAAKSLTCRTQALLPESETTDLGKLSEAMGLALQVKAKIAVSRRPHCGLWMSNADRLDLLADLEEKRSGLAAQIEFDETGLRKCLRPATGPVRFNKDLPDYNVGRLKEWLAVAHKRLDHLNSSPVALLQHNGAPSIFPVDWGVVRFCDPQLALWSNLDSVCRTVKFLRTKSRENLDLSCELLPRLQFRLGVMPLAELVGKGYVRPRDGHVFVIVEFPDLVARALLAACRHRFQHDEPSTGWRDCSNDLLDEIAVRVLAPLSQELQAFELTRQPPEVIKKVVAVLMLSIGLKLSDSCASILIAQQYGVVLDVTFVRTFKRHAIERYAELDQHLHDTWYRIAESCGISRQELPSWLETLFDDTGLFRALRQDGPNEDIRHVFEYLQQSSRYPSVVESLQPGQNWNKAVELLMSPPRRIASGRMRGRTLYCEDTAEFLDLADDFVKAFAYEVAMRFPLAAVGNVVAIEFPTALDSSRIAEELVVSARVIGQRVLGLPLLCSCRLAESW